MMAASAVEGPVQMTMLHDSATAAIASSTTITPAAENADASSGFSGQSGGTSTDSSTRSRNASSSRNSGEDSSPQGMVEEQQEASPRQPPTVFNAVSRVQLHELKSDVLIMPCTPNIFTGANFEYFGQLAALVGAKRLESSIIPYFGAGIGQVHLINTQMAPTLIGTPDCFIKAFALVLYPPSFAGDSIFDLYLCYRNALDRAAEEGHTSIAFVHPAVATTLGEWTLMRIAVCTISHWLVTSAYRERINSIAIVCDSAAAKENYDKMLGQLADNVSDPLALFPNLRPLIEGRLTGQLASNHSETAATITSAGNCEEHTSSSSSSSSNSNSVEAVAGSSTPLPHSSTTSTTLCVELAESVLGEETRRYICNTSIDTGGGSGRSHGQKEFIETRIDPNDAEDYRKLLSNPRLVRANEDQLYERLFRGSNGKLDIQLSTHLIRRVLLVESERGLVYTFRFAYSHGDRDENLNFVCISCDSASRATGLAVRAKAVVDSEGALWHKEAHHHLNCRPMHKGDVILVQLQRRLRLYKKQNGKLRRKPRAVKVNEEATMDKNEEVEVIEVGAEEEMNPSRSEQATTSRSSFSYSAPMECGVDGNHTEVAANVWEEEGRHEEHQEPFFDIADHSSIGSSGLEALMYNEEMWTDVTDATMMALAE